MFFCFPRIVEEKELVDLQCREDNPLSEDFDAFYKFHGKLDTIF